MPHAIKKIAIVAPASPLTQDTADKVTKFADSRFGDEIDLRFHPQCFLSCGHFAGSDEERAAAFLDVANDGIVDAVWFARGGYGSCRLGDDVYANLGDAARQKTFLGYSDLGSLMARLYREGIGSVVHGPMPQDIVRANGLTAIGRALDYLVRNDEQALEPSIRAGERHAAFNITTLAHLMGTRWQPDLEGHIVLLEDVAEYHYRIDRAMFTIFSNANFRKVRGVRLGRCSDIPENDRPFGADVEAIAQDWCARAGVPYLGRADIGHDADNKIVPFGTAPLSA